MTSHIEAENVVKEFENGRERKKVLDNVSFGIERGEFVSFLGPSGAGKTTLLRIIAGLEEPTAGHVNHSIGRGDLGFVSQETALFPWKTVKQNLELAMKIGVGSVDQGRVKEYLEMVELYEAKDKNITELSGGMKQRLELARALVHDPEAVLMDEPFGGLDEMTKRRLYGSFSKLIEKEEKTIVYVTHDIKEAYLFSDNVNVLDSEGHLVDEISPEGSSPRNRDALRQQKYFDMEKRVLDNLGDSF